MKLYPYKHQGAPAIQWNGSNVGEIVAFVNGAATYTEPNNLIRIHSNEGVILGKKGNYLVNDPVTGLNFVTESDFLKKHIDPIKLRRLTTMTSDEFEEIFGKGYSTPFKVENIAGLTSLYALHNLISRHGGFETYPKLVAAGFDVTFLLDRN